MKLTRWAPLSKYHLDKMTQGRRSWKHLCNMRLISQRFDTILFATFTSMILSYQYIMISWYKMHSVDMYTCGAWSKNIILDYKISYVSIYVYVDPHPYHMYMFDPHPYHMYIRSTFAILHFAFATPVGCMVLLW